MDGAPFLSTCFNEDPSGERAGAGAGAGNTKKTRPGPGPFSGAGGGVVLGARVFQGPGGPVTNTKHKLQEL